MEDWGTDKPDRRLGSRIHRVDDLLDSTLISTISKLDQPVVEAMQVRVFSNPEKTKEFMAGFLASNKNWKDIDKSQSGFHYAVYDPKVPMAGLSTLPDEESVKAMQERFHLVCGDLLVIATRPDTPFQGQSHTPLGNLRQALHHTLVRTKIIPAPRQSDAFWILDFPLFSKCEDSSDPGQGGTAGLKSTHHPFTAPTQNYVLKEKPLKPESMLGDHFDLVINGVEVGGGSRRIHDADLQYKVLHEILKLSQQQIAGFKPLLNALRAGCPPHAGFALGFDRLMTILLQKDSVRDVIAFPKIKNGRDPVMGSPAPVDAETWKTYHLEPTDREKEPATARDTAAPWQFREVRGGIRGSKLVTDDTVPSEPRISKVVPPEWRFKLDHPDSADDSTGPAESYDPDQRTQRKEK